MKGILGVSLAVSLAIMTQPSNARAAVDSCGATIYSQVGTATIVSCPPLSTSNSEGCLLKLSFLQCEKKKGDSAIRINPGDLVVWDSSAAAEWADAMSSDFISLLRCINLLTRNAHRIPRQALHRLTTRNRFQT